MGHPEDLFLELPGLRSGDVLGDFHHSFSEAEAYGELQGSDVFFEAGELSLEFVDLTGHHRRAGSVFPALVAKCQRWLEHSFDNLPGQYRIERNHPHSGQFARRVSPGQSRTVGYGAVVHFHDDRERDSDHWPTRPRNLNAYPPARGINYKPVEAVDLQPDRLHAGGRVRQPIPVAGGEEEFTRYGFRDLLEARGVDLVQPDLGGMGGLSEARIVATMASAFGVRCQQHVWGTPVALAASLHFLSWLPDVPGSSAPVQPMLEYDRSEHPIRDTVAVAP